MNGIPRELDWVQARAACSLKKVFSELHDGVAEDVRVANSVCGFSPRRTPFELVVDGRSEAFTVRRGESIRPTVTFMLEADQIVIASSKTNEEFRFTVGLNDEGRCQLRLNSQEFEQWQVRKMALEALFFET
jgi:hypothetical protein